MPSDKHVERPTVVDQCVKGQINIKSMQPQQQTCIQQSGKTFQLCFSFHKSLQR